MTQTAAAKTLKTNVPTIRQLVQRGILDGEINEAGVHGRTIGVVSRESLAVLQSELETAASCEQVAERLGMDRHRILKLIHDGLLPRSVRIANAWKVPEDSVSGIENKISSLPVHRNKFDGWLSVKEATRRHGWSGLTNSEVMILLLNDSLRAARLESQSTFAGLLLNEENLKQHLPKINARRRERDGVPLNHLAKTLFPGRPTKERTLKKFIDMKLLSAKRKSREWRVQVAEVKRFQETYCLADEAAQILGRTRSTLARWEAEGRIAPVYGKRVVPGAGFSLYRRARAC